ncbi:MAG: protein kinase [Calditrichaceae bacterium]
MIGQLIAHYKIVEKLGEGGMGIVYKAEDSKLKRQVAIKFLPQMVASIPTDRDRFKIEAQAAAAFNHPNSATIYAIEEVDDTMFIVMEYLEGQDLKKKIQSGPMDIQESLSIAIQIAEGLNAAHAKGIIHRDIKSANIMLAPDIKNNVKIMDFGLAKIGGGTQVTQIGSTLGTVAYMSPEQAMGGDVDLRADIWSFGVVLYEMLTGELPFKGEYESAVMYSIMNEEPEPPSNIRPEIPEFFDQMINNMLAKDRDERYNHTEDLLEDLRKLEKYINNGEEIELSVGKDLKTSPAVTGNKALAPILRKRISLIALGILFIAVIFISGRYLLPGGNLLSSVPDVLHIAVIPFTNIGNDPSNQALSDGLAETLTSQLNQLEQFEGALWVIPASEMRANNIRTVSDARQMFGVNLAITGSVQRNSEGLRVTMNLVESNTLRQLDSKMIDDPMKNLGIIQDEAVMKLADMLNIDLRPEILENLNAGKTSNPGAYEFYLQGRGYMQNYTKVENLNLAIELFERAVTEDPSYALAFAGLGEAYLRKFEETEDVQWIEKATNYCNRAVDINARVAPIYVTLGAINQKKGNYEKAHYEFQRALQIDPFNADAYRGNANTYMAEGRLQEAESVYKKAIELKPDYWGGYNDLGVFLYRHGRYEDAIQQFKQVVALTPQNAGGYRNLGAMYFYIEKQDEAIRMFKKALEIQPDYSIYSNLATMYFYEGNYNDAAQMYEKALGMQDTDFKVWGYLGTSCRLSSPPNQELALKAFARAESLARERLMINPKDADILSRMATYFIESGQIDSTLVYLNRTVELNPKEINIWFRIGATYEQIGRRDSAIRWIEKAVGNGYSIDEINRNPVLTGLRKDTRYAELEKRYKN